MSPREIFDASGPVTIREYLASEIEGPFAPVDFGPIHAGDLTPPEPELLQRVDGRGLLYRGQLHWLYGEPESGKSWLAYYACAQILLAGGRVAYLDWESDPYDAARRLRALGVPDRTVQESFMYFQSPLTSGALEYLRVEVFAVCDVAVFDACSEAMATEGYDPLSQSEVEHWIRTGPAVAVNTGCAVVVVDHVVKSHDDQGRWPIGAQHKLARALVGYRVDKTADFAPGVTGWAKVLVTKDRLGGVRSFQVPTQTPGIGHVANFKLDATDPETLQAALFAPQTEVQHLEGFLEQVADRRPRSKRQLLDLLWGSRQDRERRLDELIEEGRFVEDDDAPARGGHKPWVLRP